MKKQRESYEQMQAVLKEFLDACRKTDPWVSSIETLASASGIMADLSRNETESAALYEVAARLGTIAALHAKAQIILANLPEHPDWPCDGCQRWTALGCNRKTMGGFWE